MKRQLAGLAALFMSLGLLAACTPAAAPGPEGTPTPTPAAPPAPTGEVFTFTRENLPRLDGSTSTAPLAEAVCSVLLGEPGGRGRSGGLQQDHHRLL